MDILADSKLNLTNYELEDSVKQSTFTAMKKDEFQEYQKKMQEMQLANDETLKIIEESQRHVKAHDEIQALCEDQFLELQKCRIFFQKSFQRMLNWNR